MYYQGLNKMGFEKNQKITLNNEYNFFSLLKCPNKQSVNTNLKTTVVFGVIVPICGIRNIS